MATLEKEAARLLKLYGSKANVARELLDQGHSVGAISKAVPMAYSQVHSINKRKQADEAPRDPRSRAGRARDTGLVTKPVKQSGRTAAIANAVQHPWGELPDTKKKSTKPKPSPALTKRALNGKMPKATKRVGKLRTPGLPSDIDAGPCANCDHDLAIRRGAGEFQLIHINISAEEYLSVVQFCHGVPRALIPVE